MVIAIIILLALVCSRKAVNDSDERFGIQARAADEQTVDFTDSGQHRSIFPLDTAAVEDSYRLARGIAKVIAQIVTYAAMDVIDLFRCGVLSGANCPHR